MAAAKGSMVAVLFLIASLIHSSSAESYDVGNSAGWTIPQDVSFYDDWAANQNFVVGDKLVFASSTSHNVYEVSATDADACDASNPLALYVSTTPTVILGSAGTHAFICEFTGHCLLGMKMIVDVVTPTRVVNETTPPARRSFGKGPVAAPVFSPPAPSSAFRLHSSLTFIAGAALAVIVPSVMS